MPLAVTTLPEPVHQPPGPTVVRIELDLGPGVPDERVLRLLWTLEELAHAVGGERVHVAGAPAGRDQPPSGSVAVRIYPRSRTVRCDGEQVDLTRREYDLLLFLAEHPRQVFTRQQLLWQLWQQRHGADRTVDVHVHRLRAKLTRPGQPLVDTVRGVGYRLAGGAGVDVVRGAAADPGEPA
jgi:transcriptional regulator